MKKNLIIWGAALLLILAAVVTVNNYNRTVKTPSTAKGPSAVQETASPAEASASTATSTSTPAPTSASTPALVSTPTSTSALTSRITPTSTPARTSTAAPTSTSAPAATPAPEDSGGNKAPGFTLTDLNGTKVSLSDFKGKKVFLNFWATWCSSCRGELPDIEKIYRENNKDLVILAVNWGEDKDAVKSFIDKNRYNFMVLLDTNQEIIGLYNISTIPASFFIDRNGNLVARQIGAMDETEMKEYINSIK